VCLRETFLCFLHQYYRVFSFLFFQFAHSGAANVNDHVQVRGLFCVSLMILCGFVQVKALNLGVLPMIVHPAPSYGRYCFYLRYCQVFLGLLIVPILLQQEAHSLVVQAISRFRSRSHQLPMSGSDGAKCIPSFLLMSVNIFAHQGILTECSQLSR